MAFSLTPKLTISLFLLLLSMFAFSTEAAFSAEAACSGHCHGKHKIIRLSGFFPVVFTGETLVLGYEKLTACPDPNSAVKATYGGARLVTGRRVIFGLSNISNVTDDSGYRHNGSFALLGEWDQTMRVSEAKLAPTAGTRDFTDATGSCYFRRFSIPYWQANCKIRLSFTLV